ncbi:hypothetical protein, partial [Staphylococcus aureus]
MIRRPPRSTRKESSAASDVYKRQLLAHVVIVHHLIPVSYTHLRAHETLSDLVCRLLLEKNFFFNVSATPEIY